MFRRIAAGLLALPALLLADPAAAQGYAFPVDIRAQPLSSALRDLARQTGVELLFDRDLVRGMRAPQIRSRQTVEAALRQLLGGTDLTMRRASSGAWVIERRQAPPAPSEYKARVAVDLPISEILVTAKRSQNADIQRRENDVQPYQVVTGEELVRAHRDNLDQFFRSRVTGNTQVIPTNLWNNGETNSQIDLRGLGVGSTLILVDGRRMPRVPDSVTGVGQPDLNAIPLHAIERVETLTGTAGSIYGFGATGGVVNIVLKRDYRGAELHATGGITSRGDAARLALEGRAGFTPDDGRTDVMIEFGWSREQPLLIGKRDYMARNRELSYELDPENALSAYPKPNGILAKPSFGGGTLTLKPEYGGTELGTPLAFLPLGFDGDPSRLAAALLATGGKPDLSLTPAEAQSQMGSNAHTFSAIASVRHDFGGGFEGYLDALFTRNRGRNFSYASFGTITMSPDAPQNPFTDYVAVTFPAPPEDRDWINTSRSLRVTAGLTFPLPFAWQGTAEATVGRAAYDSHTGAAHFFFGPTFMFGDPDDDPALTPFGNWDDFLETAEKYAAGSFLVQRSRSHYQEQSLRVAGPLFETAGGSASLNLQAQRRRDRVPTYQSVASNTELPEMEGEDRTSRAIAEHSFYGELRVPMFGSDAPLALLNGLELQVAARYDHQKFEFAADAFDPDPEVTFRSRFSGTALTAGAKVLPTPWLMLRASYATGKQPPEIEMLMPYEMESSRFILLDPKRGNAWFTDDGEYTESIGGNPALKPTTARTLSLGGVLNPFGDSGPRLSIDYSHIGMTGVPAIPFSSTILEYEDRWPDRVLREPLTDEDRALGYTGGRILFLDSSAMNAAKINIKTLDALLSWNVPFHGGILHVYAAATRQFSNRYFEPGEPEVQRIGYYGYPLKWRANAGLDFTFGSTSFGANLQYFGRYLINSPGCDDFCSGFSIASQGSRWVSSQTYVDLSASRRFNLGGFDASIDFGIVNLFDQEPPREVTDLWKYSDSAGYSMYGDPRGRRFELVLNAEF